MTTPPVEILTLQSLLARRGLAESLPLSTLSSERVFAFLGTDENPQAFIPIQIDRERIAQFGPLAELSDLNESDRRTLWQGAIHWARTQSSIAAQIVCQDADLPPLAQLGWDMTTQIVQLVRTPPPEMPIQVDPAIEISHKLHSSPEMIELVNQTLFNSLDLPEALAIRSPSAILASWEETIPETELLILTARSTGDTVGILVVGPGFECREVRYLGVDHRFRRKGWGRRLLQAAIQHLSSSAITAFVDVRNPPALGLYQQLGFVERFRSFLIFRAFPPT